MRFFHLSDLHIGKQLHGYALVQDQTYILTQIVEKVKEERPDAIVIAGDIYDKSVPSGEAYCLFDRFLTALSEIEPMIPVMLIAGNHDSAERLQFASSFLEKHRIYISVLPPQNKVEHLQKITLQDAYGEVNFYLLPFMKPGYVRHLLTEGEARDYEIAYRKVLEREKLDVTGRNVLVAHQFFTNQGKKPEICDSEYGISTLGGMDAIDISVLSDFDYVAAGHIHGAQTFAGGHVRYCGTPLKYSVSEEHHQKSITVVTLTEKGNLPKLETILLEPLHDVRRIKGKLDEILMKKEFYEDYVSITLTDEKELYRPKDFLEEHYERILEVMTDNSRMRAFREKLEMDEIRETEKTPLESFCEFYQMMQGQPISVAEQAEVSKILAEILD